MKSDSRRLPTYKLCRHYPEQCKTFVISRLESVVDDLRYSKLAFVAELAMGRGRYSGSYDSLLGWLTLVTR